MNAPKRTPAKAGATTERGFTLLEVLVATLIMGIAVAGTLSGIAAAARNASRLTQYDRATLLARQKMDELLVDSSGAGGTREGFFNPAQTGGASVGWHANVTAFEGGPSPGVVDRIELEIWWMDGDTRRVYALEGYRRARLRPGEAPPRGL
ncbi:MAG TPA: type II secretion system protein [Bryobacteraceae bacterium]|nr:type II secretion system protein [Bryobacteraceae bacterium]